MKPLFFVLLLVNISLALWELRSGPSSDAPNQARVFLPPLLLSHEVIEARRGEVISGIIDRRVEEWRSAEVSRIFDHLRNVVRWQDAAMKLAKPVKPLPAVPVTKSVTAPPLPIPKAPLLCFEVGPFSDLPTMKQWLKDKALSSHESFGKETTIAGDFQVYYPVAKTPEQLQLNKQLLLAKGITDFWTVPSGDNKGGLSLGVFSDNQRAQAFKLQLQAKGVTAEVKQRVKIQSQFYAKIMMDKSRRESLAGRGVSIAACSH